MATSTLIQYLDKTQNTISGGTTPVGASSSNRSQTETFLTETAITAGDWVAFDTTQTGASRVLVVIVAGASANGNPTTVGVALESVTGTATSPQPIKVVVSGYCDVAKTNGGPVAGQPLVVQTVAGDADVAGAGITAPPCGVCLGDPTAGPLAGFNAVWVYKQF